MLDRPGVVPFLAGVIADATFSDPPNALHPVRAIGGLARRLESAAPARGMRRRAYGALAALALPCASGVAARGVVRALRPLPGAPWWATAAAVALSSAQRTLMSRALEVAHALESGDLGEARALLGYHLVSRPTRDLSVCDVAAATIESVAENLGDGVAGPWLAYAAGGVTGAWAYRAVNTLDSLWGYRSEGYAELGWGAARLDDLANLVPARAAALAICAAAALRDGRGDDALRYWRRDAGRTESPNAGQPMAAMAGAIGVTLRKRGHYELGAGLREPRPDDIHAAVDVARLAAALLAAAVTVAITARGRR